ncbi:hypothetical protein [Nonomuraea insulae]|uniref:Uncharacterized protein n=1 Tax=Nonomuraea insulae TaxID=1616787 RepID=A0ABW1CBF5_9ACTN
MLEAVSYAWYLVAEYVLDFYVPEPSLIAVIFAAVVAAALAALARVAARRGGSKGVLVVVLPYVMPVIVLAGVVTDSVLLPLIVGPFFVVPLLVGLVRLVAEPAGTVRADGRAPAALVTASVWAGPVVILLGVVGIGDARRIAYEEARLKGGDNVGDPLVGDTFLDAAAGGVRAYAVLFAVAVVVMTVLARRVRSQGGTPGTQAAVVVWGLLYLVLMAFAVSYTPFAIGDSDEFVHRVVVEGPVWYVPAVRTILACSVAALVGASVLLVRRPRESMV